MNEVDISPLCLDLAMKCEGTQPAAEDLRQALNALIAKYELHPSLVISLLARAAAGYIKVAQHYYDQQNVEEDVEEDFLNMLDAHLTDLDMVDVKEVMEKMKKEEMN